MEREGLELEPTLWILKYKWFQLYHTASYKIYIHNISKGDFQFQLRDGERGRVSFLQWWQEKKAENLQPLSIRALELQGKQLT